MKLAEALIIRADYQKRIEKWRSRESSGEGIALSQCRQNPRGGSTPRKSPKPSRIRNKE